MDATMVALASAVATRTPVLLWGSPGIGKTAAVRALAQAMGLHLEVVIASIHEPADFSGLPWPDQDRVRYLPPEWALRLAQAGQGILFLDEVSTAPPAVQAALLRVVHERVVGQLVLPDDVVVIAAANPPEEAAGGWELSPPLANRFAHLDWDPPRAQDWADGLLRGFPSPALPVPRDWEKNLPLARGLVAAFVQSRPELLKSLPQDPAQRGRAWPSPRTWEMASRMLAAALAVTRDDGAIARVVGACVGPGVGIEFAALVGGDTLLDPAEVLKDPKGCQLPDRTDKVLALLGAVSAYVADRVNDPELETLWYAAWKVIGRVYEDSRDVAAIASRSLLRLWNQLMDQGRYLPFPYEESSKVRELAHAMKVHIR